MARLGNGSRPLAALLLLIAAQVALAFVPVAPATRLVLRRPLPAASPSTMRSPLLTTPPAAPSRLFSEDEEEGGNGALSRLKRWWKKTAKIDRKKMAELGASAVCSYGLVSNLNYCGTLCAAKIIFEKKHAVSPFAPGQWKPFLAIYGGLWVTMNFVRPLRVWIALGLTPYFDRLVERIRSRFGVRKAVALGITIFFVNVLGTFAFLGTGLYLSSVYTGVPLVIPFLNKAAGAAAGAA